MRIRTGIGQFGQFAEKPPQDALMAGSVRFKELFQRPGGSPPGQGLASSRASPRRAWSRKPGDGRRARLRISNLSDSVSAWMRMRTAGIRRFHTADGCDRTRRSPPRTAVSPADEVPVCVLVVVFEQEFPGLFFLPGVIPAPLLRALRKSRGFPPETFVRSRFWSGRRIRSGHFACRKKPFPICVILGFSRSVSQVPRYANVILFLTSHYVIPAEAGIQRRSCSSC